MAKAIYRIPCFAHLINLVFVNSIKNSTKFKSFISDIQSLVHFLRQKESVKLKNLSAHLILIADGCI